MQKAEVDKILSPLEEFIEEIKFDRDSMSKEVPLLYDLCRNPSQSLIRKFF